MEPLIVEPAPATAPELCTMCHRPLSPGDYFCPNCGTPARPTPLSVSAGTQTGIYLHSIVLPMILFLSISKWRGYKYFKSKDPKARQIGRIAVVLIVLSTFVNYYLAYVWTTQAIQSSLNGMDALNAQLGI